LEQEANVVDLNMGFEQLPGIGPVRAAALGRLGIRTVGDLLYTFPRSYEDRTVRATIRSAPADAAVCVSAMVAEVAKTSHLRKGLELTKVRVVDATGSMQVSFFNQAYRKHALTVGKSYIFYGKVEGDGWLRGMTNPEVEEEETARFTGRIMPVYRLTAGISNRLVTSLVQRFVVEGAALAEETLPASLRGRYDLAALAYALQNIHLPESWEALALARRRILFEELLCFTCGLTLLRDQRDTAYGPACTGGSAAQFLPLLPFAPTGAQKEAMGALARDMAGPHPMNRLLQGDVGSGKTAVAAFAAFLAAKNGWQSAMMVPTELLAKQHYRTLTSLLEPAGVRVGLLTASEKAAEKRVILARLAGGELDLIVGTHALLTDKVAFSRLGLVVADEQHRFGVGQRATLIEKAAEGLRPHVLVMSATPIPRTLSLILYRDLDVTVLGELPPGRTPVKTYLVGEDMRQRIDTFIRKLVAEGRQIYIVCPAIEEGEEGAPARKAATEYAKQLRAQVFPDLRLGLLHGQMKAKEREREMDAFVRGETQILVSTTVIEVGVDVPNATLMLVENAECFGLSQLHQLRGRVGRGAHASYCVLMTDTKNTDTLQRLKTITGTTDGFQIAEEDLKLRGPGDILGSRQHGLPRIQLAELAGDVRALAEAQDAAQALLAEHPGLEDAAYAPLRARIDQMFAQADGTLN